MDDREKLMERYDDAAFALMMDEYAEAEGEAILAEFRAAAEAGDLPEMPEELDKACRETIRREYARRERRVRFRQLRRAAARVAVAVFAVIGIMSTLVMSVEAWRVPFLEKVEQFSKYSVIQKDGNSGASQQYRDPLESLVPSNYVNIFFKADEKHVSTLYQNEKGEQINFDVTQIYDEYRFDTEDATVTEMNLAGYDAVFVSKNQMQRYTLVWIDYEKGHTYNLMAEGMGESVFLKFAETVAEASITPNGVSVP